MDTHEDTQQTPPLAVNKKKETENEKEKEQKKRTKEQGEKGEIKSLVEGDAGPKKREKQDGGEPLKKKEGKEKKKNHRIQKKKRHKNEKKIPGEERE